MDVAIVKETILIVICFCMTVSAAIHEPQVYEILDEPLPGLVRTARHSDGIQINYYPPVFNFRAANQQDVLKSKYLRQQKIDASTLRNAKLIQLDPDEAFEMQRREPVHINQFSDAVGGKENDWKPIQPKFLAPVKKQQVLDLDLAASEDYEEKVPKTVDNKSERQDVQMGVIYIQPDILKGNLDLDTKAVQEILKNSAPELSNLKPTTFQINELQGLLGQNPQLQLQGLQKLLGDMPVVASSESAQIQVQHNGSPALESGSPQIQTLQDQLDTVNKARADALLAAAQKEAEAHVQAQHEAIALAQKKAEQEALAQIDAHNKGIASLSPSHLAEPLATPSPIVISSTEGPQLYSISSTVAPQEVDDDGVEEEEDEDVQPERTVNQQQGLPILSSSPSYDRLYAPSFNNLRANSTRGLYQSPRLTRVEVGSPRLQLLTTLPAYSQETVYAPGQSQRYIPIQSTTLAPIIQDDIEPHHVSPESSRQAIVQLTKTNGADTARSLIDTQLYSGHDVSILSRYKRNTKVEPRGHINFSFDGDKLIATDLDTDQNFVQNRMPLVNRRVSSQNRGKPFAINYSHDRDNVVNTSPGNSQQKVRVTNNHYPHYSNNPPRYKAQYQNYPTTQTKVKKSDNKDFYQHDKNGKNVIIINNHNFNEGPKNHNALYPGRIRNVNVSKHPHHSRYTLRRPINKHVTTNAKKVLPKIVRAQKKSKRAYNKVINIK